MLRRITLALALLLSTAVVYGRDTAAVTETGRMQTPRACHTASPLADGRVLIAGGIDSDENALDTAELYDPTSGTFTPTGDMLEGRSCAQAVTLGDGQVLVFGGWGARTPIASIERYNPADGTFTPAGEMTVPRSGFTLTLLNDGRVLIIGGSNRRETHASAELYDPLTATTTPTASLSEARTAHTATLLGDGRVLVTGGSDAEEGDRTVFDTTLIYDPAAETFTSTASMSVPRYKHAARLLPDGNVLVIGGSNQLDWRGRYTSSEIYDVQAGTFEPAPSMEAERFKFDSATTLLEDGSILVAGGSQLVERYLPDADTFTPISGELDADRFYQTSTLLPDGAVLITGGYDYNINVTDFAWLVLP